MSGGGVALIPGDRTEGLRSVFGRRGSNEHHEAGPGQIVLVPAGVPHAFLVESATAKVLSIQPTCECEPFYRGACEPLDSLI